MTEKQAFWTSLPGILTGVAAVITAVTGLYIAIFNFTPEASGGMSGDESINQPMEGDDPLVSTSVNTQAGSLKPATAKIKRELNEQDFISFPKTGPLVVCENFQTVNTHNSLMSWSNYYHQQIVDGNNTKPDDACNKTIGYRGMAHCLEPDNQQTRQDLLESLALCRKLGFEAHQVTLD